MRVIVYARDLRMIFKNAGMYRLCGFSVEEGAQSNDMTIWHELNTNSAGHRPVGTLDHLSYFCRFIWGEVCLTDEKPPIRGDGHVRSDHVEGHCSLPSRGRIVNQFAICVTYFRIVFVVRNGFNG